eukprot:CAMPEP_0117766570 /NCGR_PEP_ID=MMETSP0947-20121206/20966_1 /TAXON_ID=44440 /ORGANISM="Chattonella subsalsa, Strain CCMP2191" /LENGTH=88 /DNA_ID=CAMNT_0005589801 /DNA_START=285 /DNA_END=551 /DNA_ORIENTATION=+
MVVGLPVGNVAGSHLEIVADLEEKVEVCGRCLRIAVVASSVDFAGGLQLNLRMKSPGIGMCCSRAGCVELGLGRECSSAGLDVGRDCS